MPTKICRCERGRKARQTRDKTLRIFRSRGEEQQSMMLSMISWANLDVIWGSGDFMIWGTDEFTLSMGRKQASFTTQHSSHGETAPCHGFSCIWQNLKPEYFGYANRKKKIRLSLHRLSSWTELWSPPKTQGWRVARKKKPVYFQTFRIVKHAMIFWGVCVSELLRLYVMYNTKNRQVCVWIYIKFLRIRITWPFSALALTPQNGFSNR